MTTALSLEAVMMGLHDELDRGFFVHQQALLDRDFVRAGQALAAHRDRIERHMADE